jgi:hypothetical protein
MRKSRCWLLIGLVMLLTAGLLGGAAMAQGKVRVRDLTQEYKYKPVTLKIAISGTSSVRLTTTPAGRPARPGMRLESVRGSSFAASIAATDGASTRAFGLPPGTGRRCKPGSTARATFGFSGTAR